MSAFVHDSLRLLFDVSLRSIALALFAAGLLRLFRVTDHNARHRVWSLVLAAMFFLPLLQFVSPVIHVPATAASLFQFASEQSAAGAAQGLGEAIESPDLPEVDPAIEREHRASATSLSLAGSSDDRRAGIVVSPDAETLTERPDWLSWKNAIFAAYAIVAVALIARLVTGMWAARRMTQRSRRIDPALIGGRIAFECDAIQVPLTTGFVSPRILLPTDWQSWNEDLLKSVLNHEQAHLLRRDNLITVLSEANRCLYWFHPLAWLLRRELAMLAELICDDYAIAAAPDRRQYAQHLLEIAGRLTGGVRRASVVDIFMARTPQVVSRIDSILDVNRPLTRRLGRSGSALLASVAIPLLIGAAGLRAGESTVTAPAEGSPATSEPTPADSVGEAAIPEAGHDIYGDPLPNGAIARLGTIRLRQPGQGWMRIAFLPNGSEFVVGGWECDARCWDARTGVMTHRFDLGGASTQAFCVSPTDGAVATLGIRRFSNAREAMLEIVVWNPKSWTVRKRIAWKGGFGPKSMAFSPDGKTIAVSDHDGVLQLYPATNEGERILPRRLQGFRGEVESLVFSPTGDLVVAASRQGVVLWNLAGDVEPQRLEEFPRGAGVVRFSPDGRLLAVGAYNSPATLYDIKLRKPVLSIAGDGEGHSTEGMCFSADGTQLIIPSRKNVIEFFDVMTGKLAKSLESQRIQPQGIAVSPQGEFLASIGTLAAIDVWDLKSGKRISDQWVGNLDAASQTLFTLDDEQVITGGLDGSIRFWNAGTGQQERILQQDRWVAALALSPRGESLLSLGLDDTVRLWDAATGNEKLKLPGHGMTGGSSTSALAFSPDGKQFYSFGMDLVLRTNETATGKMLAERNIRPSDVKIESGPDGRPLPDFGDPFAEDSGGFQFDHVVLTASGTHLLIGGRTTSKIYIFDCETGRETAVFKTDVPLQGFAVSPDGGLIATFEEDISPQQSQPGPRRHPPTLRLRDLASQKIVREVTLPGRYAYRAAFSADGKSISFTTSQVDAKTRTRRTRLSVFDVETLKEVAGMDVEPNSIRTMAFSHDGTILGTGYADSSVLLWDLDKLRD